MGGQSSGTPVGKHGLTTVGSPNRVQRRVVPAAAAEATPEKPAERLLGSGGSGGGARSLFAERVYQSTRQNASAGGPIRVGEPIRAGEPIPAEPARAVDGASQRLYALCVLGLVVARKVYEAAEFNVAAAAAGGQGSGSRVYMFGKWTAIDLAVVYAAWRAQIPRVAVTAPMAWRLAAAAVAVNVGLFLVTFSVVAAGLRPAAVAAASAWVRAVRSVPVVGPWAVGDSELLINAFALDGEHILGRHTIHVLPHSLAHMNPGGVQLCIAGDEAARARWVLDPRGAVEIPILINGTRPASITYAHTSLETGERRVESVARVGALRVERRVAYPALGQWEAATYFVAVRRAGAYELVSVRDARGLEFRRAAGAQRTVVVGCPAARLQWRAADGGFEVGHGGHASMCEGAGAGPAEVVVEGVWPMAVEVERAVGGAVEAIEVDTRELGGGGGSGGSSEPADEPADAELRVLRRRTATLPLNDAATRAGEYVYRVVHVRDGANHTAGGGAAGGVARMVVHARPHAAWARGQAAALTLSDDPQRASRHALRLALGGAAPWTVEFSVATARGARRETRTFASAADAAIDARDAGVYALEAVRDAHCSGRVARGAVAVERAQPPTANVSAAAITARECGGSVGARVALQLAGRAPWAVHFRERNLRFPARAPAERVVRADAPHHVFDVTPDDAGTLELAFFRVDDADHPSGAPLAAVVRQPVHAQPSAALEPRALAACPGDAVAVRLHLRGEAPWDVAFTVTHAARCDARNATRIATPHASLPLGALAEPGLHVVALTRVTDANGCARDLPASPATHVTVRAPGPHVTFACPAAQQHVVLAGAAARIPVAVAPAVFPADVAYRRLPDGAELRATLRDAADAARGLPAPAAGEYELVSASGECRGSVDRAATCSVRVEPRPRAWFAAPAAAAAAAAEPNVVCEPTGALASAPPPPLLLPLALTGAGPWRVEYAVDYWADADATHSTPPDRTTTHAAAVLPHADFVLRHHDHDHAHRPPGRYRFRLTAVADQRYTRPQPLVDEEEEEEEEASRSDVRPLAFERVVSRSPTAVLRAYAHPGSSAASSLGSSPGGWFARLLGLKSSNAGQSVISHCLAPGQELPASGSLSRQLPEFRIEFDGSGNSSHPPFDAWIEVVPPAGKSEIIEMRAIATHSHPVVLPDRIAALIGRYHLRLVRTRDALGCEHSYPDAGLVAAAPYGLDVEYIEAPTVRATTPVRSLCVGDILAFDIRALGPCTVHYSYNNAHRSATTSKRLFRRIADSPGNFTLSKVCHRNANNCCSELTDLSFDIHDVPRVRIGQGKDVDQDILEGDLVNIPLHFAGSPPFSFTWQRRALAVSKKSTTGKVLESHTVKDLNAFEYTITTSSEGTFEVSFIQDRFCQYPKAY